MAGHSCELRWVGCPKRAALLRDAISADDPGMFDARVEVCGEEAALVITISSDSLRSLQGLADDILACLSAAEAGLDALP